MKRLKIAFLWHQHQPYYKIENEFVLPWVLLHGTKDYYDIPEVLKEFPKIKQTFNFAPSLNIQLEEYISKKTIDIVQKLTLKKADELSKEDKELILKYFFSANFHNMIFPNKRYYELYENAKSNNYNLNTFNANEWRDLQVWFNLSWFGYFSSQRKLIKELKDKGSNFTEYDKQILINEQLEVIKLIINQYKTLKNIGQIDISCSPFYHPILPLLIDSKSALENLPNIKLPEPNFEYPEDANKQISDARNYFNKIFDFEVKGMWPSEGSISNDTLDLFIDNNIKWVASDETVLFNSLNFGNHLLKYFPYKYNKEDKEIVIFFRDHNLSDKIGFQYSSWNEEDASTDFLNNLFAIRDDIINNYGINGLDDAVVSIILDGENCWEYYRENGIPFLRSLYHKISENEYLETVTFSSIVENQTIKRNIKNISAGSWINGNFSIWIGHNEDLIAWNFLSKAREEFEIRKNGIDINTYNEVYNSIMIAEGSDWFWWYGPEHPTDTKPIFDNIFRYYLRKVYNLLKIDYPKELDKPLYEFSDLENLNNLSILNFIEKELLLSSKKIIYIENTATMHSIGEVIKSINYIVEENLIKMLIDLNSNFNNFSFFKIFNADYQTQLIEINKHNIHLNPEIINYTFLKTDFKLYIEIYFSNKIKLNGLLIFQFMTKDEINAKFLEL
jgi:alpha-amylase/alpha-mannosidase (GH57 family)